MAYIDTIRLTAGHSLITGNTSKYNYCKDKSCEVQTEKNFESFGFWETNSPNFHTYYPDVKAEDLKPTEDEFIFPIFRALSQTIVRKNSYPIDFTKPGVLENSMDKLVGVAIMTDHEIGTGNTIGAIKSVNWQNGYKLNKLEVPPGLNIKMSIDGKSNPRIARGILSDPPSYNAISVTVSFKWESSHPDIPMEEFYNKWGTYDAKGELIRKVATEIVFYAEVSIVPHGADPFAKLLVDGKMVNPHLTAARESFRESFKSQGLFNQAYLDYKGLATDQLEDGIHTTFNNNNMNFEQLMQSLGLSFKTQEEFQEHLNALTQAADDIAALREISSEISATSLQALLNNQITPEQTTELGLVTSLGGVEGINSLRETAENAVTTSRNRAVGVYKTLKGDSFSQAIVETINKANLATALEFEAQYTAELNEKVPLTCTKCGSHDVSRKAGQHVGNTAETSFQDKVKGMPKNGFFFQLFKTPGNK